MNICEDCFTKHSSVMARSFGRMVCSRCCACYPGREWMMPLDWPRPYVQIVLAARRRTAAEAPPILVAAMAGAS